LQIDSTRHARRISFFTQSRAVQPDFSDAAIFLLRCPLGPALESAYRKQIKGGP